MNNSLIRFNSSEICAVDPKEIPVSISNCFTSLKEVESKVEKACDAAKKSLSEAKNASGKTINCLGFGTKDAVYALQSAVEAGAISQQTQQEVLDRILAFQQATAKGMKIAGAKMQSSAEKSIEKSDKYLEETAPKCKCNCNCGNNCQCNENKSCK